MKQLLFIAILAIASGCGSLGTQKIVKDPVHSIRESLPAGWVIKDIHQNVQPWNYHSTTTLRGTAIYLEKTTAASPNPMQVSFRLVTWHGSPLFSAPSRHIQGARPIGPSVLLIISLT